MSKVLQYLAPWIEKTDGEESVGSWEITLATKMMVKLLELWLTQGSRGRVEKMLEYYHPLERLVEGKCVEGSLRRDEWTGKVTFRAYQRQPRERHERVVCQLENGWLKESPQRYKFYNSVRKDLGRRLVDVVMHRGRTQTTTVSFRTSMSSGTSSIQARLSP